MQKQMSVLAVSLWLALGISGCASTSDAPPTNEGAVVVEQPTAVQTGNDQATTTGANMDSPFNGRSVSDLLNDPNSPVSQQVFYFDFDSSELDAPSREKLALHARLMRERPELKIVLEGHADERGSREYNLALGERRSIAVQKIFDREGVASNRIKVVSFGEERAVAMGHNEASWRLNRRVELVYSGY